MVSALGGGSGTQSFSDNGETLDLPKIPNPPVQATNAGIDRDFRRRFAAVLANKNRGAMEMLIVAFMSMTIESAMAMVSGNGDGVMVFGSVSGFTPWLLAHTSG